MLRGDRCVFGKDRDMDTDTQLETVGGDGVEVGTIGQVIKVEPGKSYPRTMRTEDNVVYMKQTTELQNGTHYFEYGLNLENVDGDVVIKHAAKDINIVIMRPRLFKKLTSIEVAKLDYVLDPEDYPPSDRVGVPKRDKEIMLLIKMKIPRKIAEAMVDDPENALDKISEIEEAITDPDIEDDIEVPPVE